MRRTKAAQIYRKTGAAQLLIGHRKLESTVRYLEIEVDDAPNIASMPGLGDSIAECAFPRAALELDAGKRGNLIPRVKNGRLPEIAA